MTNSIDTYTNKYGTTITSDSYRNCDKKDWQKNLPKSEVEARRKKYSSNWARLEKGLPFFA